MHRIIQKGFFCPMLTKHTSLPVLGDRSSRLVIIRKIKQTTSAAVRKVIQETLGVYPLDPPQADRPSLMITAMKMWNMNGSTKSWARRLSFAILIIAGRKERLRT